AESVQGVLFAVPFRFAAGAFVPLFGVPECSGTQIERVPADSDGDRSREAPLRFPARSFPAADFLAAVGRCALRYSSASSARRCAGNSAGLLAEVKATVHACSVRTVADGEAGQAAAAR